LTAPSGYFATRFRPDPQRERVWRHIAAYLTRWIDPAASVLDVGAGHCSFVNAVQAGRRVAVDIHDPAPFAAPGVETLVARANELDGLEDTSFDVVFASNLLEHLERTEIVEALAEFKRILRPDGTLILIQPNFRLCANEYFDDYTHVTPLSDRSLVDLLGATGFLMLAVEPRFLPLTLRSRGARLAFLVPSYLRSPWRPCAKQMLVVCRAA
jgi:ubiquinone/menaquinone biosynthesis C-methylase UbiE